MTTVKTEVNLEKALAWIDEHWTGQKACPICENSRWGICDMVGEVRQMPPENPLNGEAAYPLVIVTCQTCGYSLLFSAVTVGLVTGEE